MLQYKDRVKESSTSTGIGVFALAGAATGFRTFASVCSVADTFYYAIEAVSNAGVPTGDWEVGFGSYSALNQLTRTTVLASSNAGAAVNFAAGTKYVWIDLAATQLANMVARNRRNLLINGNFAVNQRAYASTGVLASGAYGHDRWKAGGSGGDYSFSQLAHSTTITIAANKSLIQVVEDKNVEGGSYVLSWTGTAQARVGLNSAVPAGAYAASPIFITGQSASTTMSVEFNSGTLTDVQLEAGAVPSSFERRLYPAEFRLCQRYCTVFGRTNNVSLVDGGSDTATAFLGTLIFPVEMRTTPTLTTPGAVAADFAIREMGGGSTACSATPTLSNSSPQGAFVNGTVAAGLTAGRAAAIRANSTSAVLVLSAEL